MADYKTCIVSVAFRRPYTDHAKVQEKWLRENSDCEMILFRDCFPLRGSVIREEIIYHFQKSLYGFKPHAIQEAIDAGFRKIIWLDPSVLPTAPMEIIINSLDTHPMIVRIGDAPIVSMSNKKSLKWFNVSEEELKHVKHVGGTIYGFNFDYENARDAFDLWKYAEAEGIFGTQEDFMAGHWADEACMALSMHCCGVPQYWEEKFTYKNQKEL